MKIDYKDAGSYLFVFAALIALSMVLKPWLVITVAGWDLGVRISKALRRG